MGFRQTLLVQAGHDPVVHTSPVVGVLGEALHEAAFLVGRLERPDDAERGGEQERRQARDLHQPSRRKRASSKPSPRKRSTSSGGASPSSVSAISALPPSRVRETA